jgi:NADP-dependent aldehyde dehydrogenase
MIIQKILIDGQWREANSAGTFQAENPATATLLPEQYPISSWEDVDAALRAAAVAFQQLQALPRDSIARFLEIYADRIDARAEELCVVANLETALPVEPRLLKAELPRTTNQLRLAAAAARDQGWCQPTIDTQNNIRSYHAPLGPVAVFGPNNFPFAYNGISGGDFASAIAAGNPVIAKAHPLHPGTSRMLAEEAVAAIERTGLPPATVQMIYAMDYADGERMIWDRRLAAVGFTGGKVAGVKLKSAADWAGKPIFLEMSSINPILILPGALAESGEAILNELTTSCLMGTGQFCTSPGLICLVNSAETEQFIAAMVEKYQSAPVGTLLSKSGQLSLNNAVVKLTSRGASLLCGGQEVSGPGYRFANTILRVSGQQFLDEYEAMQTEAFGNATMFVVTDSIDQIREIVQTIDGNLTGSIYSSTDARDEESYQLLVPLLRQKVGRLLNDKMPTGVAVSPAMNHGGPFPATGHPGFTAVGFPASIIRFSMLQCFDNVREHRLPEILRNKNPTGTLRRVDGSLTRDDVPSN